MENVQPNLPRPGPDPQVEFARLYDNEMPRVYRFICHHVGSCQEAEEVTGDVFRRAQRQWPQVYRKLDSPRAWLFALARERLADHARRPEGRPAGPPERCFDLQGDAPGPEAEAARGGQLAALLDRLAGLPDMDRTVLTLRFAGGLEQREIGSVLEIDEPAAALSLLQALRRLRETMEEKDDERSK